MLEWGCGAHNRAHQSKKTHCSCKSKGKKFHYFRSRFNPDHPWPKKKKHKYKSYKKIMYLKKRQKPTKDSTCFNCKQKGHWAHQCPRKKNKPKLSALFAEELDPKWWDLFYCAPNEEVDGNVIFLDPSEFSEDDSDSLSSSSEFSDSETLNWECEKPTFDFCMFSSLQKPDPEKRIQEIDWLLEITPTWKYTIRENLRKEKVDLLRYVATPSKDPVKVLYGNPSSSKYAPTDLYFDFPDQHKDRQNFRKDREKLLKLQLKEQQQMLKITLENIKQIKLSIEEIRSERNNSSEEELSRVYEDAFVAPKGYRKKKSGEKKIERSDDSSKESSSSSEKEDSKPSSPKEVKPSPALLSFGGTKFYMKITFCPPETKPYEVDCLVDSGCQLNLLRKNVIPEFYWERPTMTGKAIDGSEVPIQGQVENFPLKIGKQSFKLSFHCVNQINDDCVLGAEFLELIDPMTINKKEKMFEFYLNGTKIQTPLFTEGRSRSREKEQQKVSEQAPSSRDLHKMERSICYAQIHGEKMLKEISEKLITDCTSESPNAFWHREKYFVSLPYDPLVKITPQKASTTLMSPTEIQTFQQEINDLLQKGLIEPSKSAWACRGFYVNKHSEKKRGKMRLVVNFKPLNKVLQNIRYPLPNKISLLQRIKGKTVFSKFDLKSGFYQIGIVPEDRHKTAFVVPHGHYQWKVMPFGLKNAPSEFQKRMEDIFREYPWLIIYIDDILVCSKNLQEHLKHLQQFYDLVFRHGLVLSKTKMEIGKTEIEFLGFRIAKGQVILQDHILKSFTEFPDILHDKIQLQRFLGNLNYIRSILQRERQMIF
jgi:hypothetical protein